jgi:hypothetical protein
MAVFDGFMQARKPVCGNPKTPQPAQTAKAPPKGDALQKSDSQTGLQS